MHKLYMMVFPVLLVVFLACGCANDKDASAMCEFDCDSIINLKIGTANSADAIGYAPLLTNTDISEIGITYDKSIISYDVVTGRIEALNYGSTRIKSTIGNKSKSVLVKVERAIFCETFQCTDFEMELGKTVDLLSSNHSYFKINKGYNMGYTFESMTPDILSINPAGVITGLSTGEGCVKVLLKDSVDETLDGGYKVLSKYINITVRECRNTLELEVLDSDYQVLNFTVDKDGYKHYSLYSRAYNPIKYILKVSSDQKLDGCWWTDFQDATSSVDCRNLITNSTNTRLVVFGEKSVVTGDNLNIVYQNFSVVDCGVDIIQKCVVDNGANFYYNWLSERIIVDVYVLATDDDISVNIYSDDGVSTYDKVDEFGRYCLYADNNGESLSLVYIDPQFGKFCDTGYTFECENLTAVPIEDGKLIVTAGTKPGIGKLILTASDGGGARHTIEFYNFVANATISTTSKDENIVYLVNGRAKFYVEYTIRDSLGNLISDQQAKVRVQDTSGYTIKCGQGEISYIDSNTSSALIEFAKSGKYVVILQSKDGAITSEEIIVYVL